MSAQALANNKRQRQRFNQLQLKHNDQINLK